MIKRDFVDKEDRILNEIDKAHETIKRDSALWAFFLLIFILYVIYELSGVSHV